MVPSLRPSRRIRLSAVSSSILPAVLLVLVPGACGGADEVQAPPAAVADGTVLDGTYPARCGCAIDGIGACGNYILVDGAPVALGDDLGLGPMDFCGQDDRAAAVKGTVAAGGLVATSFELAD